VVLKGTRQLGCKAWATNTASQFYANDAIELHLHKC